MTRPVPRLPDLDQWAGQRVALQRGRVVAAAPTSSALASVVRSLGPVPDLVTEFVRPGSTDTYAVGAG